MQFFEKNEKGLKTRISWVDFSKSCQHIQYEQRNAKRSKRQIGWVGSFFPAIWDKVCQSLHFVQCALLWAQFVMEKGLLRQIHAILLCSCLQHIQTIVWTLVSPIYEKDTWQIHVIGYVLSHLSSKYGDLNLLGFLFDSSMFQCNEFLFVVLYVFCGL